MPTLAQAIGAAPPDRADGPVTILVGPVTAYAAGIVTMTAQGGTTVRARFVGSSPAPAVGQTVIALSAPPYGVFCLGAING